MKCIHKAVILPAFFLLIFSFFSCTPEIIYKKVFTVSFDSNGGSGEMEDIEVFYGETVKTYEEQLFGSCLF